MINSKSGLRLAGKIDWGFLDRRLGEVYAAGNGQPPLLVRLIAGTQERREPPQEGVKLKPAAGEDGVDAVAVLALEVIAVHSMVGLEVADHRLDGGAALHSRGPQVPAWRLDGVARVAGGLRLAWLADRLDPHR